jgi:hypothetical protein
LITSVNAAVFHDGKTSVSGVFFERLTAPLPPALRRDFVAIHNLGPAFIAAANLGNCPRATGIVDKAMVHGLARAECKHDNKRNPSH